MPTARTQGRCPVASWWVIVWISLFFANLPAFAGPLESLSPSSCRPHPEDHTSLWWANGWIDGTPRAPAVLCLQAGHLVAEFDTSTANLIRLGRLRSPPAYEESLATMRTRAGISATVPDAGLRLSVRSGDSLYHCIAAATNRHDWMNFPVRIIESGRFFQRFDILQLIFANSEGARLNAEARLEVVAWPDRLHLRLEISAPPEADRIEPAIVLTSPCPANFRMHRDTSIASGSNGRTWIATLTLDAAEHGREAEAQVEVSVEDHPTGARLATTLDSGRGWHRIELPVHSWSVAEQPDRLDRYRVHLANPSAREQVVRLLFDDPSGTPGITGVTPLLLNAAGEPTGIPVQTSKNWHRQPDRRLLFEGPWLHAFTQLRLPAHSQVDAQFTLTWARWGGVPAASHAQLCLVGWGWNQLWDQAAIGSWGESICYEPDAIQMRCRIDDIRPLMITGMGKDRPKWTWTHNVGGGDFLVYEDGDGRYQPWRAVRSAYLSQGPNLTEVQYSGVTADDHIACRVTVSSPRTDDLNRAYHHLRYDILKPTPFRRLAFYQLGSDRYHWHQYGRLARGNAAGLIEEYDPGRGGRAYRRAGIPCPGTAPWFSLHDAIAADGGKPVQGGWATRGLVVRSWKARLGGRDVPPHASIFGTEAGRVPSANLELSPPPELKELQPGDFVEADLELLVLPMAADDYYGPNTKLKASLVTTANTWREVHRQAAGNDLQIKVQHGRLTHPYPPVIQADRRDRADFEITGGLGYLPVTISGLDHSDGWILTLRDTEQSPGARLETRSVGQAIYVPEAATWRVTFNVPMDTRNDRPVTRRLALHASTLAFP
jgi:hypothetical protein